MRCCGLFPNHIVQYADAEQAYIQADLERIDCWITLPPEPVSAGWSKKYPHMRNPVAKLVKAVNGDPDDGSVWEELCDTRVHAQGLEPMGAQWLSTYFRPTLKLCFVYVDDFWVAGPKENLDENWEFLATDLTIHPPQTVGLFL